MPTAPSFERAPSFSVWPRLPLTGDIRARVQEFARVAEARGYLQNVSDANGALCSIPECVRYTLDAMRAELGALR